MEQSNRNQGSTKMAVKMAAGIGAVVLLSGALATAALASVFVVGRNGRSSDKDRRRPKSPPRDESDKTHHFNVLENKNPSSGAIKEVVESDNSNHSSALEEKPGIEEINICDVEASEPSLCCIGPEKQETDAISDGSVVMIEEKIPLVDEKLRFELQNEDDDNEIPEEGQDSEGVRIGGEMAGDECGGKIKDTCQKEAVEVITEKQPVQEDSDEEAEENVNATEEGELDEEKRSDNGELKFSESRSKDGQKTILPLLDSLAMGHENANGEEKEGRRPFPSENVEIVQECEFIGEQLVDDGQMTILPSLHVGHEVANGEEKEDRPFPSETVEIVKECEFTEEQWVEDGQKTILLVLGSLDVGHENANGDEKEGRPFPTDTVEIVKECEFIEEQLVEDGQNTILGVLGNDGVEHEDMDGDEEKVSSPVDTAEIILKDSELIEGGEEDYQMKNVEDHLAKEQESCGEADEFIVVKKYEDPIEVTGDDLEEEVISVSPESIQDTENNENDLKPEIQKEAEEEPIILEDVEVTKEDNAMNEEVVDENTEAIAGTEISPETVTAGKGDFQIEDGEQGENLTEDSIDETVLSERGDEKEVINYSGNAFIGKYVAKLAAVNDRLTDSTSRRMMIVTLSAVSSISCSWFFGLSFARLCLVMFLTMVLSSMVAAE